LRERVLAIVNLIAQYVMGAEDTHISEQELITELMAVGYEAEEINDAFTWMETIALHPASDQETSEPMMLVPTYRIFSDQEKQLLTSEAQGFLIKSEQWDLSIMMLKKKSLIEQHVPPRMPSQNKKLN